MKETSRYLPGLTYEQECKERERRHRDGLLIKTSFDPSVEDFWKSKLEIESWFYNTFNEILLWKNGQSKKSHHSSHFWLPRTKEQAVLLKLAYGGKR